MSNNPFEMSADLFYARNQAQLEQAMWGHELSTGLREDMRVRGLGQIDRYSAPRSADDIGYKAMAEIQVGVVMMGLGYPWKECCFRLLEGYRTAIFGDEYHMTNGVMTAGCTLAYWTNKADQDSISRCGMTLGLIAEAIDASAEDADRGILIALSLPAAWLAVYALIWNSAIDEAIRGGVSRHQESFQKASDAAKTIDSFSRNSLTVYDWMMDQIHLIN